MAHKTPANAQELLRQAQRLIASPAYHQPGHPDREAIAETVGKIYRTVYGTEPVHPQGIKEGSTL